MANVRVTWTLPTTRESGKPLDPAAIQHVRVDISADGGANYAEFGAYTPDVLETVVQDLEPGDWAFRGTVVDSADRESAPKVGFITIVDASPPGALPAFDVALV